MLYYYYICRPFVSGGGHSGWQYCSTGHFFLWYFGNFNLKMHPVGCGF